MSKLLDIGAHALSLVLERLTLDELLHARTVARGVRLAADAVLWRWLAALTRLATLDDAVHLLYRCAGRRAARRAQSPQPGRSEAADGRAQLAPVATTLAHAAPWQRDCEYCARMVARRRECALWAPARAVEAMHLALLSRRCDGLVTLVWS